MTSNADKDAARTPNILTDDARNQEVACQQPGRWLVEGLTILRMRTWGYPPYWVIFDGDRHFRPSINIDFPSLGAARNWLADYFNDPHAYDGTSEEA